MKKVAVVAHAGKSMGGGLAELREVLAAAGVSDPYWTEVPKSKYAPERVEKALSKGAETVFVWGGDGMVQRCVDVLAGTDARLAILPAGTANLFASNLEIPDDIEEAVSVGLGGLEKRLDVGKINGEHFAVMAGAGLDARMMRDTDGGPKDKYGRLSYIWAASRNLRNEPFKARIEINGDLWYDDDATCLLFGNVGALFGGLEGREKRLDVGKINGEHFAVMAGAGLDARMMRDTDGGPKDKYGRLSYIWAASKNLRNEPFKARIEVNGDLWYDDDATCLLFGNVGALFGGLEAFDDASPEDGQLEVGVTHADSLGQWARTVARTAVGSVGQSPFVQATKAERVTVEFDRKILYELDGGDRKEVKRLKVKVKPEALTVMIPQESTKLDEAAAEAEATQETAEAPAAQEPAA